MLTILHEVVGYKSGIAASIEHMCDLLNGTGYDDDIRRSELNGIRIRSENYESLHYELIHQIGVTAKPYGGLTEIIEIGQEVETLGGRQLSIDIQEIYQRHTREQIIANEGKDSKKLDPEGMMKEALDRHGGLGLDSIVKYINGFHQAHLHSSYSEARFRQWDNLVDLDDLFKKFHPVTPNSRYFDQRFIDYLSNNSEKLGNIHWRKFEELIAECYLKQGFEVKLGPGSNDDGVDIRVWKDVQEGAPSYVIQCKRGKKKIDKVTIKGLYTDVMHERGDLGILATTSELSVGAKKTISARNYPIEELNGSTVKAWLNELRTPGSGIVRV